MKRFDALAFFLDHDIRCWTSGKNVRPGWVHIRCPFCDDKSNHLGVNPMNGSVACWRCKAGSLFTLVSTLLNVNRQSTFDILAKYDYVADHIDHSETFSPSRTTPLVMPGDPLMPHHEAYIRSRGFDPSIVVPKYGLKATNWPLYWEDVEFSNRLMIPINDHNGRLVSFQGRTYNGHELRYKCAPLNKVIKHHKHTLYGEQFVKGKRIVVVEGIFDQWRMGDGYVASFGTAMTQEQLRRLARYEHIIFLFDPEKEAQEHAMEYAKELNVLGRRVNVISADFGKTSSGDQRDCGDLTEKEAQELNWEILSL